ncbi:hypothetical protein [Streptomyces sp. NPDC047043]|uniref:hypothetical protein n=1 Tax=Streptomyces sp. NPDC047043 TaxID=3154497 RepID=UPI0033FAB89C
MQERQWITARRSELDALAEELAKQLQEVQAERDELAIAERVLNRLAEQARADAGAVAPVSAKVAGRAVLLIPHRSDAVDEGALPGDYARRPEGGICSPCRNREADAKEECVDCRRMMISYRRLPDGTSLCQTCAPKNLQPCCRCGRVRRVHALTSDGPVCGGCYSSPARL